MTKVLLATEKPFAASAVAEIRKVVEDAGYELALLEKYTDVTQFHAAVADADALIIRSDLVTPEVLDAAKKLKIVVRAGAGYDNVDLAAATAHGVVVENTPGQNANAVAELALGMMVYLARGLFNGKSGYELKGKKLGLHAYGAVARRVGEIAQGFGMDVYAYDPYISKEVMEKGHVTPVDSLEALYSTCHYVSLHIPATAETKGSVNYGLLSTMPAPAVLVNTARKEVVNEADLLKMFENQIGRAHV